MSLLFQTWKHFRRGGVGANSNTPKSILREGHANGLDGTTMMVASTSNAYVEHNNNNNGEGGPQFGDERRGIYRDYEREKRVDFVEKPEFYQRAEATTTMSNGTEYQRKAVGSRSVAQRFPDEDLFMKLEQSFQVSFHFLGDSLID